MNKKIIIYSSIFVMVVGLTFFIINNSNKKLLVNDCVQACFNAEAVCPSLINKDNCEKKCLNFDEETINYLKNIESCEELSEKSNLIFDIVVPNADDLKQKDFSQDCEAACSKYVLACLSLDQNLIQDLFGEDYDSCLKECSNWDSEKISCIITAFDCPIITKECGL